LTAAAGVVFVTASSIRHSGKYAIYKDSCGSAIQLKVYWVCNAVASDIIRRRKRRRRSSESHRNKRKRRRRKKKKTVARFSGDEEKLSKHLA
jgi:hypothetical protein